MTTVGEALEEWHRQHPRGDEDVSSFAGLQLFWVKLGPIRVPVPHPGQLHWHDLHHLLHGYEPDLIGEMEISAFELRTGVKTGVVLFLCLAGGTLGLLMAPVRTVRAWRSARGQRNLYGSQVPYEQVLRQPLPELRRWMHLD